MNKKNLFKTLVIFAIAAALTIPTLSVVADDDPEFEISSEALERPSRARPTLDDDIIFDNGMTLNMLGSTQWDTVYNLDSIIADDFVLTDPNTIITDVHWLGGTWNGDYVLCPYQIKFYDDDGTGMAPGTEIASYDFVPGDITETYVGPGDYYSYSVDLPTSLALMGGVQYWISIQGILDFPPQSGWALHYPTSFGADCAFKSVYFGVPNWAPSYWPGYDCAFQLTGIGWEIKMTNPQWPDEDGWDVHASYPMNLADDWMCSETGFVSDLHWWGSWWMDFMPEEFLYGFYLSIHEDIPADDPENPYGYSMPGELLWETYVPYYELAVTPIEVPGCGSGTGPFTYEVQLFDTYGDGWTTGTTPPYHTIDIYVGMTLVYDDVTLTSGPGPAIYPVTVYAGDIITLIFTDNGNWDDECYVYVKDQNGNNVIFNTGYYDYIPYIDGPDVWCEVLYGEAYGQGWFFPQEPWYEYPDHCWYYQYDYEEIPYPFLQFEGEIYWLDITADVWWPDWNPFEPPQWGWKTSEDHWNDDAVWRFLPRYRADYNEDFEASDGGYTHAVGPGPGTIDVWEWGNVDPSYLDGPTAAHSGTKCWATDLNADCPDYGDMVLDSIPITVGTGSPELTFYHWFDMGSAAFDAGNVKISTDGGATWSILYPNGGYPYTASSGNQGIAYEPCYAGYGSGNWDLATFDLTAYAGVTVIIRWHYGTSTVVPQPGWWIDDVMISGGGGGPEAPWYELIDPMEYYSLDMAFIITGEKLGSVNNVDTGEWFNWIQDAIDDSDTDDEDLIEVYLPWIDIHPTGTYVENVNVYKEVTLKAVEAVPDPTLTPVVVDGNQAGPCFYINADNVIIDGFEIINGLNGIEARSSGVSGCTIKNNDIHDNVNPTGYRGAGIMFYGWNGGFFGNTIENNEIYNNARQGIFLGWFYGTGDPVVSTDNDIIGNTIHDNGLDDIHAPDASCYGIQLTHADYNFIAENTIYHHQWLYGGYLPWGAGVYLWQSFENQVVENVIYRNDEGVRIWNPLGKVLLPNYINFNWFGKKCEELFTAIANYDDGNVVDARWNWYGQDNGPGGLIEDAITGRVADGAGEYVKGDLNFDPWRGIDADIVIKNSDGIEQTAFLVGEPIVFDGSGSFHCDINGVYVDNIGFEWNLDNLIHSDLEVFGYVYAEPGIYEIELMTSAPDFDLDFEDNNLLRDFAHTVITISAKGEPLVAFADPETFGEGGNGYQGKQGEPIQFHGLATGGVPPYTWHWDFADGYASTEQNPRHTYDKAGEFTVTLTVSDKEGNTASDTATATVEYDENDPPIDPVEINDIKGGFGLSATIVNPRNEPIEWNVNIEGKYVFKGTASGTIEPKSEETIETGFVLGLGNVEITINAGEITQKRSAFMLGPFILNLS
jgi:PKD repeat protein